MVDSKENYKFDLGVKELNDSFWTRMLLHTCSIEMILTICPHSQFFNNLYPNVTFNEFFWLILLDVHNLQKLVPIEKKDLAVTVIKCCKHFITSNVVKNAEYKISVKMCSLK